MHEHQLPSLVPRAAEGSQETVMRRGLLRDGGSRLRLAARWATPPPRACSAATPGSGTSAGMSWITSSSDAASSGAWRLADL